MAEVIVAPHAGFCFGVKRAIALAERVSIEKDGRRIWSMGPLIHNPQEVQRLRCLGIEDLTSEEDATRGRYGDHTLPRNTAPEGKGTFAKGLKACGCHLSLCEGGASGGGKACPRGLLCGTGGRKGPSGGLAPLDICKRRVARVW
jgi:hypothetical protein